MARKKGIIEIPPIVQWFRALLICILILSAEIIFWLVYGGYLYVGPSGVDFVIQRILFCIGIGLCSATPLVITGVSKKTRGLFALILFICLFVFFFVVGGFNGTQFNALLNPIGSTIGATGPVESYNGSNAWVAFDVNTSAVADLTVGLNIKLISDSITYFVPSFTLFIIVIQILYAGEGGFVPAVIEGFVLLLFIALYNFIGGFQTPNTTVITLMPLMLEMISNVARNAALIANHPLPNALTRPILACS